MSKIILESDLVSVEWLKNHQEAENLIILDATIGKIVDDESVSPSKQIPKALFFDIKNKFSDTKAEFPNTWPSQTQFQTEARNLGINKGAAIIVCDDKGIYSSARAWWLFKNFGHTNVAVLDGGLPEWLANGFNTEHKHGITNIKGNFEAILKPKAFVNLKGLQAVTNNKSSCIIDARSSERFNCEVPEPRAGLRRGTIPNSINIPFLSLLENGKFKSKEELRSIFNAITTNKDEFVFSCGSGITACVLALGATLSGYDKMTIYDGSWTEYGTLIN